MTVTSKPFANAPSHAIRDSRAHRVTDISFKRDYVKCLDGWEGTLAEAEAHGIRVSRARSEAVA